MEKDFFLVNNFVSAAFQRNFAGNTIFYPWGKDRVGYVVRDKEQYEYLRSFLKKFYILSQFIFIALLFNFKFGIILFALLFLWFYLKAKRITKTMPAFSLEEDI